MDLFCPTCDNQLTKAGVGYLCDNCGTIHHFHLSESLQHRPLSPTLNSPPISSTKPARQNIDSLKNKNADLYQSRLRARLKRLVVPELPSANPEDRLISGQQSKSAVIAPSVQPTKQKPNINSAGNIAPAALRDKPPQSNLKLLVIIALIILSIAAGLIFYRVIKNSASPSAKPTSKTAAKVTITPKPTPSPRVTIDPAIAQRDNQRKQDLKEIATVLEVYKHNVGSYPAGNDIKVLYSLQYTNPPYIKYINYDPLSTDSQKIKYIYTSDGQSYSLKAKLENPQDSQAKDGFYVLTSQ